MEEGGWRATGMQFKVWRQSPDKLVLFKLFIILMTLRVQRAATIYTKSFFSVDLFQEKSAPHKSIHNVCVLKEDFPNKSHGR